jgi:hypothetical protein
MIHRDVLCSVWFEKLQAGKTDTEIGPKCNTRSRELASSELFINHSNRKIIFAKQRVIGSYCTKVNLIFYTNSRLLKDTI